MKQQMISCISLPQVLHSLLTPTSFTVEMAAAVETPSNLPQKPTNLPSSDNKGLSVGGAVGIGVGIALFVILVALGTWIFVRQWAQKRKKQSDLESTGDTSNEEITKRLFAYGKSSGNGRDKEIEEGNYLAAELERSAVAHTAASTAKNETCLVDTGNAQK
jgi:hypothetical protein